MPIDHYIPTGILQASPSTIVDVGDYVLGPGIPSGTTVVNIINMGSYILIELSQVPWTDNVIPSGVINSGSGVIDYTGYYSAVVFRKNQSHALPPSITVSFHEYTKGWVSFKSFEPESAISMANDYYTFFNGNLYEHHIETVDRNTFYAEDNSITNPFTPSSVNVILNENPSVIKEFNTLNYEGSQSKVEKFTFLEGALNPIPLQPDTDYSDQEYYNLYAKHGWFVESIITNDEDGYIDEFLEKEGKWFNYIKKEIDLNLEKADTSDFSFQGVGFVNAIVDEDEDDRAVEKVDDRVVEVEDDRVVEVEDDRGDEDEVVGDREDSEEDNGKDDEEENGEDNGEDKGEGKGGSGISESVSGGRPY